VNKTIALIPLFLVACLSPVFSSSQLNFPRLSFEADTITGIAIVNPNPVEATVTLTAVDAQGNRVSGSGIKNPVQVKIPAGEQYAQITSLIFGGTFTPAQAPTAWIKATSGSDNLTGFFLYLNPSISFLDGADLPQSSTNLAFLQVRADDEYSTEVSLVNPSAAPAAIHIEFHSPGGISFADYVLPASGTVRFDVGTVFGSVTGASYLTVGSSNPVAGFEFVKGPGDLLGLNGVPIQPGAKLLYFPQMAVLSSFQTELVLLNPGDTSTILTLEAHRPDGKIYGGADVSNNPVTQSLGPHELVRLDVETLFGFHGSNLLEGWVEVVSSSTEIVGTAGYRVPSVNSYASVAASAEGRTRALFSHVATRFPFFTGVALLNPGSLAANVKVVAEKPDGTVLGTFVTTLQPGQRLSKRIDELIPKSADQTGGLIWVSSDIPIHAISLFGSYQSLALANIPPQPVPVSFQPGNGGAQLTVSPKLAVLQPGSQTSFKATGASGAVSWAVNGAPGGDATVGRIQTSGVYQAPANLPSSLPVTVTATAGDQMVGASVDLLRKEDVVAGLGIVRSVAYLASLKRLYSCEITGGTAGNSDRLPQASISSELDNVTDGVKQRVRSFTGDEIVKLLPYQPPSGSEVLLLVAKTSGRVLRLNVASGSAVVEIATGLNAPTAAVVDPITGGLLVAEQNQVTLIPSVQLNQGLSTGASPEAVRGTDPGSFVKVASTGGSGIAVDPCDGTIYLSDHVNGRIVAVNRTNGSTSQVVSGLGGPGHLLGLQRSGLSCPDSFHLLVVEESADEVSLVVPSTGSVVSWLTATGIRDIAPLRLDSESGSIDGFYLAEIRNSTGYISRVTEPGVYDEGRSIVTSLPAAPKVGLYTHYLDFMAALGPDPALITESYSGIQWGTILSAGTELHGIRYEQFPGPTTDHPKGTQGLVTPWATDSQGNPYAKYNSIGNECLGLNRPDEPSVDYFIGGESMTIRFLKPVRAFGLFFNTQLPTQGEKDFISLKTAEGLEVRTGGPNFDFFNSPGDSSVGLFFGGIVSDTPFSVVTISLFKTAPSGMVVDHLLRVE